MAAELLLYAVLGFVAQTIDGAVGMAFGLTVSSALLSSGVAPAAVSATIHAAEIFTTAASGIAHYRNGNVDVRLAMRLALPGVVGGLLGVGLLTWVDASYIRPVVSAYLLLMGLNLLRRGLATDPPTDGHAGVVWRLALVGGFLDASGGGGWGSLVTTSLINRGLAPRFAIGTSNAAEFFVASSVTAAFVASFGLVFWPMVLGLVIGGVAAAPLAAHATRIVPRKLMLCLVGGIVSLLSIYTIAIALLRS